MFKFLCQIHLLEVSWELVRPLLGGLPWLPLMTQSVLMSSGPIPPPHWTWQPEPWGLRCSGQVSWVPLPASQGAHLLLTPLLKEPLWVSGVAPENAGVHEPGADLFIQIHPYRGSAQGLVLTPISDLWGWGAEDSHPTKQELMPFPVLVTKSSIGPQAHQSGWGASHVRISI